jgi:hypothetical protein
VCRVDESPIRPKSFLCGKEFSCNFWHAQMHPHTTVKN